MSNVKFRHRNCDKVFGPATFAYELPPAHIFEAMIMQGEPKVWFPFGITYVHNADQYCRKTGRSRALKNIKTTEFNTNSITLRDGKTTFALLNEAVWIYVTVNFETAQVRMDHIELA